MSFQVIPAKIEGQVTSAPPPLPKQFTQTASEIAAPAQGSPVDKAATLVGGSSILRDSLPILAALGTSAVTDGATAPALASSVVDFAQRHFMGQPNQVNAGFPGMSFHGELPETGHPLIDAALDIGGNTAINLAEGGLIGKAFKVPRGIMNLFDKTKGAPATTLELKPTYGQLNPKSPMNLIENLTLSGPKSESIRRSNVLSKSVAQDVASDLSGANFTKLATEPVIGTREKVATSLEKQTSKAFTSFLNESNLQAQNVRAIASNPTNVSNIPVRLPNGKFIANRVEGPISSVNLVNRAIALKNEMANIATSPTPDSAIRRDLDAIINKYATLDKNGNITGYKPVSFNDAWAEKVNLGDKGWGKQSQTTDVSPYTSKYQSLFHSIDDDIHAGIQKWGYKPAEANTSFTLAKQYANARNSIFDGYTAKLVDFASLKAPSGTLNAIMDNKKDLDRFLLANEYKLADGTKIVGGNKRGLAKSYQFMRMWEDANVHNVAGNIQESQTAVKSFVDNWNQYKTSEAGTTLFSKADRERIDAFSQAIQTALTREGEVGVSHYLMTRLATGGLRVAIGTGALAFGGHAAGLSPALAGTVGLTGIILSARQIGKILLNHPDASAVLTKMAMGQPLGRSLTGASQILAYALRNETATFTDAKGKEIPVQLDGQGKIKGMAKPTDAFQAIQATIHP
jgi:hypothetical protein